MSISLAARTDASPWVYSTPSPLSTQSTTSQSGSPTASVTSGKDSFRSDFAAMLAAVQAGDITTAQSALSSLQSDISANGATYSPSSTSTSTGMTSVSPGQTDIDALIQAVKSGNITGAQNALTSLQSDLTSNADQQSGTGGQQPQQAAPAAHHHHHHHHGGGGGIESAVMQALDPTQTSSTGSSDTDPSTAAANAVLS